MDKNNLHDAAFGQWLKSRHLQKKHVFEGEEKRATDYSKHYNTVENTEQLNFDITQVNTVYNAQVGGYKQERDTIYYNSPTTFTHNSCLTLQALPINKTWENLLPPLSPLSKDRRIELTSLHDNLFSRI